LDGDHRLQARPQTKKMIEVELASGPMLDERAPSKAATGIHRPLATPGIVALTQGVALIPVVAWDGTYQWRIARAFAVLATAAVVLALQRLGGSWLATLSAWAWGLVGVAVGIGIGVVHLTKAGPSVYAALALGCLVTGLIASARTVFKFVNQRQGWWRLLVAPGAIVGLTFLYYPLTVALIATNTPRVDIGASRPSHLDLVYEEVQFSTPDGIRLSGWFMPGSSGAAAVLLHGGGGSSNRTAVLAHARVPVKHGYSVLAFDARGHGRSGGDGMDWGWYGDLDIAGAVDFLGSRQEVDPSRVAAVGLSMGGEQAITAAASDPRIKAVVAEGATNRVLGDDDAFLPDHPGRWVNIVADWVKYGIADWISGAEPPMALTSAVVAAAPRPILLITAGKVADERRAAINFWAASPNSVRVWNVPGANHTAGLATAPTVWETLVIGFLDEALKN
jgi:pimeloyl-ACP methyl ester carboxylesterase